MRIRFGIPLPGPFYLSSGGKGSGSGCAMLLGAGLVIGFAIEYPWLIAVAAGLIIVPGVVLGLRDRRANARARSRQAPPQSPPAAGEMS